MVTIAYWDTQGGSRPPRLLGDFQGTPTIRLFTPKRKPRKPGAVSEKNVLDYQHGERTAADMRKFLEYQLPNYSERVKFGKEDYDRLSTKAKRFGLPMVVVFTTKAKTSSTIKWLSAEYRRKLLLVEVPPSDKNEGLEAEILELPVVVMMRQPPPSMWSRRTVEWFDMRETVLPAASCRTF